MSEISQTIQLVVNGRAEALAADATLATLLDRFRLSPQRVAIEVNEQLVRRADFAATRLCAGDRVEIVTLVGGG